jgi:nucleoside-diphosphate-sugar epimerase
MFKFLNGKNILITGASGVIGSNLARAIRATSDCRIHLNYLSSIDEDLAKMGFVLLNFDITSESAVYNLPLYDVIFHCAGYGQPQKFCQNPEKTFSLNTKSVANLLKRTKDDGQFIFMSSSEIYSGSKEMEEDSPITIDPRNSRNCYILSKLIGESLLAFDTRVLSKSLRICLCYGEGFKHDDKRVLSELIMKSKNGDIELIDDGSAVRRYIHINDCIQAIANITKSGKSQLYNIGGSEKTTIKEVAEVVAGVLKRKVIIGEVENSLKDSPKDVKVSIDRYEKEFGVLNKIPLKEGIEKLTNWHYDR